MPLQKQTVDVHLNKGLDKKSSDKFVIPGGLTKAENVVFGEHGSLRKRNGYTALSTDTTDGGTIASGKALVTSGTRAQSSGNQALLFDNSKVYAWTEGDDEWLDAGRVSLNAINWETVRVHPTDVTEWDRAEVNGVAVYTWYDASGDVTYATVLDVATGTVLQDETAIFAVATMAKCVVVGNYIFVVFVRQSNNTIQARRFDTNDPTASPTAYLSVVSDAHATAYTYDVVAYDATKCVVAYTDTGDDVNVFFLNDDGTASSNTEVEARGTTPGGVSVTTDDTTGVLVAVNETLFRHDSSLVAGWSEDLDPTTIIGGSGPMTITGITKASGSSVWFLQSDSGTSTDQVYAVEVNSAGTYQSTLNLGVFMPLASKAFLLDDVPCVCVRVDSTLQPRYLVLADGGEILADFLAGRAVDQDPNENTGLPSAQLVGGVVKIAVGVKQPDGESFDRSALGLAEIDTSTTFVSSLALDETLYFTAGTLRQWDGREVSEAGFYTFPEYVSDTQGTAGSMADGTYLYRAVFEYRDRLGKVYRSAPSVAQSVTVAAGSGTATVDLDFKMQTFTNRSDVDVVLYRTEVGLSTVYYRTATLRYPYDDPGNIVTVTDSNDDATLVSKEQLYTVGGELGNILPPAATFMTYYDRRVFLAGLPSPREIWFSKQLVTGEGPGFSDAFVIYAPESVVALARLDQRLIVFAENAVYFLFGEGPTATGVGSYAPLEYLTSELGCSNAATVAETPLGIVFESNKGVYLLNRTLELQYVGAPLEAIVEGEAPTFKSVENLPDRNEVRFITSDNDCFALNYEFMQWSELTGMAAVDAAIWDGTYAYLTAAGVVEQENANYDDDGSFVAMDVQTGWVSFAGLTGYKRLYEIQLLGEFVSAHDLDVHIAYDYDDTEVETFSLSAVAAGDIPMSFRPARQKCRSFRLRIVDSYSSVNGGSMVLENLGLRVGIKTAPDRLPAANRVEGV